MKTDDQEQARLERARAIGLFRYMLIREAADPALTSRQRGSKPRVTARWMIAHFCSSNLAA